MNEDEEGNAPDKENVAQVSKKSNTNSVRFSENTQFHDSEEDLGRKYFNQ